LYADLNRINQQVKTAIENYVYAMEESRKDNLLYLSPLLEIIVDVDIMMSKLYKKMFNCSYSSKNVNFQLSNNLLPLN
jgi:hypothetical protein